LHKVGIKFILSKKETHVPIVNPKQLFYRFYKAIIGNKFNLYKAIKPRTGNKRNEWRYCSNNIQPSTSRKFGKTSE